MKKYREKLLMERIDELERKLRNAEICRDELSDMVKKVETERDDYSERYHKAMGEAQVLVTETQHKHLRCACEHGCPKEYAI